MKTLLIGIVLAISVLVASAGFSSPVYAANPTDAARDAACAGISGQAGGTCGSGGASISKVVKIALRVMAIIAGIAAVIMIIVSGLKYITSGGDAQAVAGAKRTLIYAIIGILVVAFAQGIVTYVLKAV